MAAQLLPHSQCHLPTGTVWVPFTHATRRRLAKLATFSTTYLCTFLPRLYLAMYLLRI